MQYDLSQINHLIQNRRSTYPAQYTGNRVDDSLIENILENARWAPTHKLTEPWSFKVFTKKGLKKLADFQSDLYKRLSSDADFKEIKYQGLKDKPLKASHVISIGLKRNTMVPLEEEIASVACAVQNMYLTASALGLGCYWGSGGITYKEEAKSFFDLTKEDLLLGFFYIGDLATTKPLGKRTDISNSVSWVTE